METPPSRAYSVMLVIGFVAVTTFVFLVISRGATINDDLGNLRFAVDRGLTFDYLLQPVFDHFAPGHRFLSWLQFQLGPRNFAAGYALVTAFVAASYLLLASVMARLAGPLPWIPVLAALPWIGPFGIDVGSWFASAWHQLPALTFGLLAIRLYLASRDRDSRWLLVVSAIAVVIGMGFVAKVLVAVGVIVLLEHLVLRSEPLSQVPRAMFANWPTWAVYAIPTLVYIALTAQTIDERPVGSTVDIIASTRMGWLIRFAPSLLGVHPSADNFGTIDARTLAIVIAVQAVLVGTVLWLIRNRRGAGRGLLLLLVVFLVNSAMTLSTRIFMFGPAIAVTTLRYWLEPFVYTVMIVPWLVTRAPIRAAPPSRTRRHLGIGLASAALVAIGISSATNALRLHSRSQAVDARAWYDQAATSLADLQAPVSVLDDNIATEIIPSALIGTWRVKDLEMQFPRIAVDGDPGGHVFTDDGTVAPAEFDTWYEESGRGFSESPLVATSGDSRVNGQTVCTSSSMTLDLFLADPDDKRYLEFQLDGPALLEFRWVAEPYSRPERPNQTWTTTRAQRSVAFPVDIVDADVYSTTISPRDDEQVCVERVRISYMDNDTPLQWTPGG